MKKFRVAALAVTVTAGLSLAFCTWRIPAGDACPSRSFDTGNVISDIRVISKDHHSVIHPEERTQVRDYLVSRLRALGSEPEILVYPGLEARGYSFDAYCIVAEFPPLAASPDTTWLMMTAHYDSRYPWVPVRDTVCSYGAADDGADAEAIPQAVYGAVERTLPVQPLAVREAVELLAAGVD